MKFPHCGLRTVRQWRSSVIKMMVHILMLVKTVKSMLWMSLMGVQGTSGKISAAISHAPLIHESGRRGEAKLCNHNKPKSCGLFLGEINSLKSAWLTVQGALFKHFGWKIGWGYFLTLLLCSYEKNCWKKKEINYWNLGLFSTQCRNAWFLSATKIFTWK